MQLESVHSQDKIKNKQALGIGLFEGFVDGDLSALPSSLALLASMASRRENFTGKSGSELVIPLADGSTFCIILVGLGTREKAAPDTYRRAAYKIVRAAAKRGVETVGISLPNTAGKFDISDAVISRAVGAGATLAGYRFCKYKTLGVEDDRFREPDHVSVLGIDIDAANEGREIALAQLWARDLANEPGGVIDPKTFEDAARALAREVGLGIEVIQADELERRGMNALLAVGRGSAVPPRLIKLTYEPTGAPAFTAALVGKGITFDSGGLSLKPSDAMESMKCDKSGACIVLGVIRAAAMLKLPIKIIAIAGMAENMPDGGAYRPDDIIRAYNGKTIEVNNTDAEGRLTLADALTFACEQKPDIVIDIATLTGACAVALGASTAGLFSNDDDAADGFLAAAKFTGERFWRLPIDDDQLREKVKSQVADVVNSAGRYGGAITAAIFLEHFVSEGTPWIHLDIAGTDFAKKEYSYYSRGATAYGCRTIAAYLADRAAKRQ